MKSLRSLAVMALVLAPACTTFGTASDGDDAGSAPTSTSTSSPNPSPPGPPTVLPDGAVVVSDAAQPPSRDAGPDAPVLDPASPCRVQPSFRCVDFEGSQLEVFAGAVAITPAPTATIIGSPSIAIASGALAISGAPNNGIHAWLLDLPVPNRAAYSVHIGVVSVSDEVELFRVAGTDRTIVVTPQRISVGGASAPASAIEITPPYDLVVTPAAVSASNPPTAPSTIPLSAAYFSGSETVFVGGATRGRGAGAWAVKLGYVRVTN